MVPKVVGGFTPFVSENFVALYSIALKQVVPVSSCRMAEAAPSYSGTSSAASAFAFVSELKLVYGAMNIEIW